MTRTIAERAEASSVAPAAGVPVHPKVEFPRDPRLGDLQKLFSPDWVYTAYSSLVGGDDPVPDQFSIRQVSYVPGRAAIVSYFAEWHPDAYIPPQQFIARLDQGKPVEVFQFPNDKSLPGLPQAVDPDAGSQAGQQARSRVRGAENAGRRGPLPAWEIGPCCVTGLGNWGSTYESCGRLPSGHSWIAGKSSPGPASWRLGSRAIGPGGGVVWLSEIPGQNLRRLIREGAQPDSDTLLHGLETLWSGGDAGRAGRPFNLAGTYRRAKRSFRYLGDGATSALVSRITETLDPFVESWCPSAVAHNDFYDDQVLVLDDGRLALVDLEEAGPGDPLLDVGNFLAHLRWSARFGRQREGNGAASYHGEVRNAALERFAWRERDLSLREAVCLFRICTNAIRHPREDWRDRLRSGLSLVSEVLE